MNSRRKQRPNVLFVFFYAAIVSRRREVHCNREGIAWRAIRWFRQLSRNSWLSAEWWAGWVCVFRKALVSGINWSRKGSGYLWAYILLSLSLDRLLSLCLSLSHFLAPLPCRVQGNIGTSLYQSMSHSPRFPSSWFLLHRSYTRARPAQRYNLLPRSS